jgi:hypothetical protein
VGGNFSAPGYVGIQKPTQNQRDALVNVWDHLKKIWPWTDEDLYGHYHFGKPTCPGNDLADLIQSIRPLTFITQMERQKALLKLGFYEGDVDGMWGPESKAALVKFQKSAGLISDGVWGDKTSVAIKEAMGA